jgi:hypothetical protein
MPFVVTLLKNIFQSWKRLRMGTARAVPDMPRHAELPEHLRRRKDADLWIPPRRDFLAPPEIRSVDGYRYRGAPERRPGGWITVRNFEDYEKALPPAWRRD